MDVLFWGSLVVFVMGTILLLDAAFSKVRPDVEDTLWGLIGFFIGLAGLFVHSRIVPPT